MSCENKRVWPQGARRVPAVSVTSIATCLACAALHRRIAAWSRAPWWGVALALVGVVCGLGRALDAYGSAMGLGSAPGWAGTALFAVGESALMLMWLAGFCTVGPRKAAAGVPLAYALTAGLYFGLRALGPTVAGAVLLPRRYSYAALYKLALPLMVAGLLVLSYLQTGYTAAVMLTNAGNTALTLFVLISLSTMCYRFGIDAWWMFGIVMAFARIGNAVGHPLGNLFIATYPHGSEAAVIAALVIVVGIIVLSTAFFNDRLAAESFGIKPVAHGETQPQGTMTHCEALVWDCSQAARLYGLTQREQEVLELMAQGLTLGQMAETLTVSHGTVKTHANHIYRKLNVHGRDEAVALVRGER